MSSASSKEKVLPVTMSSIAFDLPTIFARRAVPPVPGSTPSVTSGRPIFPASLRAMRRSAAIAISRPPPTVCPFRAAMTSLGVCSRRSSVSLACRQKKYLKPGVAAFSIPMLAPAEKKRSPFPRRTRTCTSFARRAPLNVDFGAMGGGEDLAGGRRGMSRRNFFFSVAGAAAAASLPGSRRRLYQMSGYPIDAETPLDALTSYLTPRDLFFVRHHWNPVFPDAKTWVLDVDGEVERPLSLSLADLKRVATASAACVL